MLHQKSKESPLGAKICRKIEFPFLLYGKLIFLKYPVIII